MQNTDIRLYYKNQLDLGQALKNLIDSYFQNKISNSDLENIIINIIDSNKDKFYRKNEEDIALKPKQILGKNRLQILENILNKHS